MSRYPPGTRAGYGKLLKPAFLGEPIGSRSHRVGRAICAGRWSASRPAQSLPAKLVPARKGPPRRRRRRRRAATDSSARQNVGQLGQRVDGPCWSCRRWPPRRRASDRWRDRSATASVQPARSRRCCESLARLRSWPSLKAQHPQPHARPMNGSGRSSRQSHRPVCSPSLTCRADRQGGQVGHRAAAGEQAAGALPGSPQPAQPVQRAATRS